jgi:hypothetical protein
MDDDRQETWPSVFKHLIETLLTLAVIGLLTWLGLGHPGLGR